MAFLVKCGPIVETPENNGISHFLEHMLFRGTPEFPSAQKLSFALDKVGADANAATFTDMTIVSQRVLPEAVEEALTVLFGMVTRPILDGIEAERDIILEECREDLDEDGQLIAMDQLSSQMMFGKHPYAMPILGTAESVAGFSAKQVKAFHRDFYRPSRSVICLSGQIQPSHALEAVRRVFGGWRESRRPVPVPRIPPVKQWVGPRKLVVKTGSSQIHCRVSFRGPAFTHPDYFIAEALARILDSGSGSPLRRVLQEERGFCYTFGVGTDSYEEAGGLHIDLSVKPDNLPEALERILDVMFELARKGVPGELVKHMIAQYVKYKRFAVADLWEFSGKEAFHVLFPRSGPFDEEIVKTQKLTGRKMQPAIRRIVRMENLGLTLIGAVSRKLNSQIRAVLDQYAEREKGGKHD